MVDSENVYSRKLKEVLSRVAGLTSDNWDSATELPPGTYRFHELDRLASRRIYRRTVEYKIVVDYLGARKETSGTTKYVALLTWNRASSSAQ